MKTITILATGSRGDVQPFLALAVGLRRRGHAVRLVCNEIYADLARAGEIGKRIRLEQGLEKTLAVVEAYFGS